MYDVVSGSYSILRKNLLQDEWLDPDLTSVTDCDVKLSRIFADMEEEFTNADEEIDFHLAKYYTKKGIRWNVYHKYLRPAFKNKNLKILYNTRVRKVGDNNN